jgi:uncharacterized protein YndB with AHSA1/START domain
MSSAQNSVLINRPVAEVFAFVTNKENDPQWRRGVVSIEKESGDGVGARYKQRIKGPMGREIPADFEVTGLEPNRRYAFRATAGPVRPEGSFEFAEQGGLTRVTFMLNADLSGPKKLLMGPLVAKSMRGEVGALDRLKALLERS